MAVVRIGIETSAETSDLEAVMNGFKSLKAELGNMVGSIQQVTAGFVSFANSAQKLATGAKEAGAATRQTSEEAKAAAQAFKQNADITQQLNSNYEKFAGATRSAGGDIKQLSGLLSQAKTESGNLRVQITQLEGELIKAKAAFGSNSTEVKALQSTLSGAKAAYKDTQSSVQLVSNELGRAKTSLKDHESALKSAENAHKNLGQALNESGKGFSGLGQAASQAVSGLGSSAGALGQVASAAGPVGIAVAAATAALVGLTTASVGAAAALQSSVANISTIADIDTSKLTASINDISTRIPQSAKEIGDSVYNIFSSLSFAGESAAQAQEDATALAEKLGKAAVGAQTDTETFATAAIGVMNAYGLQVKDVDHINDVFFNTIKNGVVNGKQLAAGLGPVTAAAKAAGIDIDRLGASIAAVTKQGGDAAQNINNLSNLFQKLTTTEVQNNLHALGVATVDATGKFLPFEDQITSLKAKLSGLSDQAKAAALSKIFPDVQARQAAQVLIDQLDNVKSYLKVNQTQAGATEDAFKKMSGGFEANAKQLGNALQAAGADIGGALLPGLTELTKLITDTVNNARKALEPILKEIGPAITGVFTEIKNIAIPIIAGIFQGLKNAYEEVKPSLNELGNAIKSLFPAGQDAGKSIGEVLGGAITFVGFVARPFIQLMTVGALAIRGLKEAADKLGESLKHVLDLFKPVGDGIQFVSDKAKLVGINFGDAGQKAQDSAKGISDWGNVAQTASGQGDKLSGTVGKLSVEGGKATQEMGKLGDSIIKAGVNAGTTERSLGKLTGVAAVFEKVGKAGKDASAAIDGINKSADSTAHAEGVLSNLGPDMAKVKKAADDLKKSQTDLTQAQQQAAQASQALPTAYLNVQVATVNANSEARKYLATVSEFNRAKIFNENLQAGLTQQSDSLKQAEFNLKDLEIALEEAQLSPNPDTTKIEDLTNKIDLSKIAIEKQQNSLDRNTLSVEQQGRGLDALGRAKDAEAQKNAQFQQAQAQAAQGFQTAQQQYEAAQAGVVTATNNVAQAQQAYTTATTTMVQQTGTALSTLPGTAQQGFGGVTQAAQTGATGVATAVQSGMAQANQAVVGGTDQIGASLAQGIQKAIDGLNGTFAAVGGQIAGAIRAGDADIVNAVNGIGNLIAGQAQKLYDQAGEIGRATLSSLATGFGDLKSIDSQINQTLKELVTLVKGQINKSGVTLGTSLGDGVASGIKASAPKALSEAQKLADAIRKVASGEISRDGAPTARTVGTVDGPIGKASRLPGGPIGVLPGLGLGTDNSRVSRGGFSSTTNVVLNGKIIASAVEDEQGKKLKAAIGAGVFA